MKWLGYVIGFVVTWSPLLADPTVIVLLGSPGSGKGTQANKLERALHVPIISTGEIFRDHVRNNTPLGAEVKGYLEKGLLPPDELVAKVVFDRMSQSDCQKGAILDGFPRTLTQAALLRDHLTTRVTAFHIELPDEEAIDRLSHRMICDSCQISVSGMETQCPSCQGPLQKRSDDAPDIIKQRLAVYHEQTEPLIVFYKLSRLLTIVNGSQSVDAITHQLLQTLSKEAEVHATAASPTAATPIVE